MEQLFVTLVRVTISYGIGRHSLIFFLKCWPCHCTKLHNYSYFMLRFIQNCLKIHISNIPSLYKNTTYLWSWCICQYSVITRIWRFFFLERRGGSASFVLCMKWTKFLGQSNEVVQSNYGKSKIYGFFSLEFDILHFVFFTE